MNKKILYISYDGLTDPLGQSQILPYLIGLSKNGYRFSIISAEKPEAFENGREHIQKVCTKNNIDWYPVKYTKSPAIISTIKDIIIIKKLSLKLHKEKNFYAVHCRSYVPAIIGRKLKQNFGIKFIFDMRGFWADERIDGNVWDLSKPHYKLVYKYFKKKEKQFLQQADAIVSLTHVGKKIMVEDWKVNKPIYVIPCAVDTDLFNPKPNNSKFKIKNSELVLGYLGSIGTWYMLDEMLDFFKALLKKYPNSKFKFITTEKPETILNKAISRGIDIEYIEISAAKREDVPKELAKIDLGIFFIKPLFSKSASSPVKQGEFMSMGIPVIANSGVGDTDVIINKYNSGILVSEFTEENYFKAIEKIEGLLNKPKNNLIKGTNAYFSLIKGVDSYFNLYKSIYL